MQSLSGWVENKFEVKLMAEKYDVVCNKCKKPIYPGTRMIASSRGNVYHVAHSSHLKDQRVSWA